MDLGLELDSYLTSLCAVSLDDARGVSFIDKPGRVYNFDRITRRVCNLFLPGNTLSSCDALVRSNGRYYFLEFKNQPLKNIEKGEMTKKAFQSFNFFRLVVEQNMSADETREALTLLVIYQDDNETPSYEGIKKKLHQHTKLSGDPIQFGLRNFQDRLYKEIHTMGRSDFYRNWYPRIFQDEQDPEST